LGLNISSGVLVALSRLSLHYDYNISAFTHLSSGFRISEEESTKSVTVPNLTRLESTSIESTRGSEPDETRIDEYRPNESRDL
jgi:hypothetical protein